MQSHFHPISTVGFRTFLPENFGLPYLIAKVSILGGEWWNKITKLFFTQCLAELSLLALTFKLDFCQLGLALGHFWPQLTANALQISKPRLLITYKLCAHKGTWNVTVFLFIINKPSNFFKSSKRSKLETFPAWSKKFIIYSLLKLTEKIIKIVSIPGPRQLPSPFEKWPKGRRNDVSYTLVAKTVTSFCFKKRHNDADVIVT